MIWEHLGLHLGEGWDSLGPLLGALGPPSGSHVDHFGLPGPFPKHLKSNLLPKMLPKRLPRAPRARFWSSRGLIFKLPGSILEPPGLDFSIILEPQDARFLHQKCRCKRHLKSTYELSEWRHRSKSLQTSSHMSKEGRRYVRSTRNFKLRMESSENGRKTSENGPKRSENDPKPSETVRKRSETVRNGPKTVRNRPKRSENGPKRFETVRKWFRNGPKRSETDPKSISVRSVR